MTEEANAGLVAFRAARRTLLALTGCLRGLLRDDKEALRVLAAIEVYIERDFASVACLACKRQDRALRQQLAGDPPVVFSDEETRILLERVEKQTARAVLLDEAESAKVAGDSEQVRQLLLKWAASDGDCCAHGRSNWGTCNACCGLDKKLGLLDGDEP